MQNYNEKVAKLLKQNELAMIKKMPKIEKFNNQIKSLNELQNFNVYKGGARLTNYIQPGNTVSTYEPDTLAVDGGNIIKRHRGRPRKTHGGSVWDDIGTVAKTAAPFLPLLLAAGIDKPKRGRKQKDKVEEIIREETIQLPAIKKRPGRPRKTQGGNFFDDAFKGIKNVGKTVYPIAKDIGRELLPIAKDIAIPLAKDAITTYMKGSGVSKRQPTKRNIMIKQLMQKHNMSLPEASKYIKDHNLA